jgi:hypothetical protein
MKGRKDLESEKSSLVFLCRKKLELNITHTFLEIVFGLMKDYQKATVLICLSQKSISVGRDSVSPYKVINLTGYNVVIWNDLKTDSSDFELINVESGKSTPWRFDNWRKMREVYSIII